MTSSEPVEIGRRARTIRRRRGLSLDVAAGLAGISKSYLSLLETGRRRFQRRGLLDDLQQARAVARGRRVDDAHAHLDEAATLAARVGERNGFRQHFGPTNVAVWRLGIGVELSEGVRAYQDALRAPIDVDVLGSAERSSSLHLDCARTLVLDWGTSGGEALRHLDTADRIAPQRVRPDPIARDLVLTLDRRTHRRVWELDSLRNRFGLGRG